MLHWQTDGNPTYVRGEWGSDIVRALLLHQRFPLHLGAEMTTREGGCAKKREMNLDSSSMALLLRSSPIVFGPKHSFFRPEFATSYRGGKGNGPLPPARERERANRLASTVHSKLNCH